MRLPVSPHLQIFSSTSKSLVILTGFEPVTYCLEGSCSIQLSYKIIIRGLVWFYFFKFMISVWSESAWASVLLIKESTEQVSTQVESLQVESFKVVEVSFEQEAKVTNAAINNNFFIFFLVSYYWPGSNRHEHCCPQDFKSCVSTYSTTVAFLGSPTTIYINIRTKLIQGKLT